MNEFKYFRKTDPIDDYTGTLTFEDYLNQIKPEDDVYMLKDLIFLDKVTKAILMVENEMGDLRGEPFSGREDGIRVFAIPNFKEGCCDLGIIIKADENGLTYIFSDDEGVINGG